eukprot:gene5298-10596_t
MSSINSKETTNAAYGSVQVDEAAMKLVQKEAVNAIQFSQQKMADLKKYVEDGHYSWKACGFLAGILLILNGFLSFSYEIMRLSPLMAILNLYLIIFGLVLVILEYKEKTLSKRFQDIIRTEALFLYRPYGRGAFYTFCGTILVCKGGIISFFIGIFVSGLGIVLFLAGRQAIATLESYRGTLFDEKTISAKFNEFNKDKSGSLDSSELAKLCVALGSPLTYDQLEAAVLLLDSNGDGVVEYKEFLEWWKRRD